MSWILECCRRLAASWSTAMSAEQPFPMSHDDAADRDALERERAALSPWWM